MLFALLAASALAPLYWTLVPARWRRPALTAGSLAALTAYDVRLLPLVLAVGVGLWGFIAVASAVDGVARRAVVALGLALLLALFVVNKRAGHGFAVLPTQGGVLFLGVSFLALKAAGALIDVVREPDRRFGLRDVLAWIAFLPTYPAGPMEDFDHFRTQRPRPDRVAAFGALDRILFGLVRAVLVAQYIGSWISPVVDAPERAGSVVLLLVLYGLALRFYFDHAGYSDVAIGVSALFGYRIAENFDRPFARRNLVQLWQHWHMTLTGWMRTYVFMPVTRGILRRTGGRADRLAIAAGQIITMTLIGLWHGLTWNFFVFGLVQAAGLVWVGVLARDLGRRLLSPRVVRWWRTSRSGAALSTALTFNYFAASCIFVVADVPHALRYLRMLVRL